MGPRAGLDSEDEMSPFKLPGVEHQFLSLPVLSVAGILIDVF
jgi:hypothetical protein